MPPVIDALGKTIKIDTSKLSIVCLVPSLTEFLFDIGLEDVIVGVTKFCVHPAAAKRNCTIIGGTKNVHIQKIRDIQPTLVIASKEENVQEQINELQAFTTVMVTNISTIENAITTLHKIGQVVNKEENTAFITNQIVLSFNTILQYNNYSVLYFIWQNPYMVAGTDTFINSMLQKAGFTNCITTNRYPTLTDKEIVHLNPQIIMLSSEPYPFKETHINAFKTLLPTAKIIIVDGEIFSWYGSRMLHSAKYISTLHQNLTTA